MIYYYCCVGNAVNDCIVGGWLPGVNDDVISLVSATQDWNHKFFYNFDVWLETTAALLSDSVKLPHNKYR